MKPLNRILPLALALVLCLPATARKRKKTVVEDAASYVASKIEEASVAPPQDQEACFSPEGNCDVKFWKFLQSAKKSLDIAIYDVTHPKIAHELLVASRRIPVRVIVDLRQAKGEHSLVGLLVKGGVPVRIGRQRGIMHNKFTLLDGQWVETGSFNYTENASGKNNENQLYLNNPHIVEQYQKRFNAMWTEAKPVPPQIAERAE